MTLRPRSGRLLALAIATAVTVSPAPEARAARGRGGVPALEPWVSPSRIFALHRPAGWKVTEEIGAKSFSIAVTSPDGLSRVSLTWERRTGAATATDVLRTMRDLERKKHPDAVFSETYRSTDSSRAVATERYRIPGSVLLTRTFAEIEGTRITLQSYSAPEARLAAERALLMNVMTSVAFIRPPRGSVGQSPPPVLRNLVDRRAADGSLWMRLPEDWTFLAAQGRVIAGEPGLGAGFIFTAFAGNPMLPRATVLQGVLGTAYRTPSQTLPLILVGFGHRSPVVLFSAPNRTAMAQCPAAIGRNCAAEDVLARWTSKEGAECLGAFTLINTLPVAMGQWSSIVAGIWGPRKELLRYVPLLEQVAASFSINDRYARQYIQSGLANLARLQQKTAAAIQDLNYARADMQKAWEARQARKDYMDSKWDDYRRGNSYWVSDLEGGKVYRTDTHGTRDTATGNYYEGGGYTWTDFTGRNPNYPAESMREITSWELDHGSPPQ